MALGGHSGEKRPRARQMMPEVLLMWWGGWRRGGSLCPSSRADHLPPALEERDDNDKAAVATEAAKVTVPVTHRPEACLL